VLFGSLGALQDEPFPGHKKKEFPILAESPGKPLGICRVLSNRFAEA